MANGRFVSRSIATNKQLRRVSFEADFLFSRAIPHLDRDGRLEGEPDVCRAIVCPLRKEMTVAVIERCFKELEDADLIIRYCVDDEWVLWFPGFQNHQVGLRFNREQPSRLPDPPADILKRAGLEPVQSRKETGNKPEPNRHDAGTKPDIVDNSVDNLPKDHKHDRGNEAGIVPASSHLREVKLSEVKLSEDFYNNFNPETAEIAKQVRTLIPENYRSDFDRLIQRVPEPISWLCEIRELPNGLNGKTLDWPEIGQRIRDYNGNGAEPVLRLFRAYMRPEQPRNSIPGTPANAKKESGAMLLEARALVDKIRANRNPEFPGSVIREFWESLTEHERRCVAAIGGADALLNHWGDPMQQRITTTLLAKALGAG